MAGLVLLYIMNLFRIVGLNIVMTDHKEYGKVFHDFIFPAVIYGTVVLLWLVWIKFFALKMKILSRFVVILGIFGLIAVRVFEDRLFMTLFLIIFMKPIKPAFSGFCMGKLMAGHLFRFFWIFFFSCLIIHFWFNNKRWTIQGALLMVIVFAITFPIYLYCISDRFELGYLFSFYMRRFVIQPLILLLIIPLFYYRRYTFENNT